jgi:hypothetical protein
MKSILTRVAFVAFVALCVGMLGQYVSIAQAMVNEHSEHVPDSGSGGGDGWIEEIGEAIEEIGEAMEGLWEEIEDPIQCTILGAAIPVVCGIEVALCLYSIFDDPTIDVVCVTDEYGETRCERDVALPAWACLAEAGLIFKDKDPCVSLVIGTFIEECVE